jgi:carbamoyl-phosphate synthase large subunit
MTASIPVLVTGVGGASIGEQVCKALRLGRRSYTLITTNTTRAPLGVVASEHQELLPACSSDEYLPALLALVARHSVEFVVPGSEPELARLSRDRAALAAAGAILLANAPEVIAIGLDKRRTEHAFASHGFAAPRTLEVTSAQDLEGDPLPLPCILKPAAGGGGSASTFVAQTRDELRFFAEYLLRNGQRALVQEYVGTPAHEYTVGVLHAPDGRHLGTAVMRREILGGMSNRLRVPNRTGRRELGDVLAVSSGLTQGDMVEFAPVREQAEAMARALDSRGPLNIQGRWDGRAFLPFEINPRFSGTTPMRAMAGFNEPELLIDWHREGGRVAPPRLRLGTFVRGLHEHFLEEPGG